MGGQGRDRAGQEGVASDEVHEAGVEGGELGGVAGEGGTAEDEEAAGVVDRVARVERGELDVEGWGGDQDGSVGEGGCGHCGEVLSGVIFRRVGFLKLVTNSFLTASLVSFYR